MLKNPWILPEGIDELLPAEAAQLEHLRRQLLDLYDSWGYELVIPPLAEYLESLLTGVGSDLELQTFKLTDQLNGRLMGIRADMTPQVARIEANRLQRTVPTRLCYMGTVLHTLPDGFAGTRSPYQLGAELYGHDGAASDSEVLALLATTLAVTGLNSVYFDLGHVGIYRSLINAAGLNAQQETALFDLLQRKAIPELLEYVSALNITPQQQQYFIDLADLHGDETILAEAYREFAAVPAAIQAIDELKAVAEQTKRRIPKLQLHYDLAELSGYHYQTGVVFAAFVANQGQAIARGGRYNEIGKIFGRSRPATGFSTDLRSLIKLAQPTSLRKQAILAPADDDPALQQQITVLRQQGQRVIIALSEQDWRQAQQLGCDRCLIRQSGIWQLQVI